MKRNGSLSMRFFGDTQLRKEKNSQAGIGKLRIAGHAKLYITACPDYSQNIVLKEKV
ncbi:hypothetical protein HYX10_00645 [Candidatus Woesearchaeota archaeon]|nr:hypothetical protein [Candidatus Woesearchaeota archaeon]